MNNSINNEHKIQNSNSQNDLPIHNNLLSLNNEVTLPEITLPEITSEITLPEITSEIILPKQSIIKTNLNNILNEQITEEKIINIINDILKNKNIKNELEVINKEKTPTEYIPIKMHNFNNNIWHVSLSSLVLVILVIILLFMKWNDKDY